MLIKIIFIGFHYIGFALGIAALLQRKKSLKALQLGFDKVLLGPLFKADILWRVALVVSIATGLYRLTGGAEKPLSFYGQSPFFHIKMTLVLLIVLLEVYPAILIRMAKKAVRTDSEVKSFNTPMLLKINSAVYHIYLILPFIAAAMARGLKF